MPIVKYVQADGRSFAVDVPIGSSVMQGAVDNLIAGIAAECGGACSCATCEVYVDEA
jgi:2Fe-2S ferredoxin